MGVSFTGLSALEKRLDDIVSKATGTTRGSGIAAVCDQVIEAGRSSAARGFEEAEFEGDKDVKVTAKFFKSITEPMEVVASGTTVLFIEFGTGFLHNDGGHPLSQSFGFTPKSWSASEKGWGYLIPPKINQIKIKGTWPHVVNGELHWYHGNPPSKSMYNAAKDMRAEFRNAATAWKG